MKSIFKFQRAKIYLLTSLFLLISGTVSAQNNAVKLTFLGWITGSTKISYERAFGVNLPQSGELALGIIGAGYDKFKNNPRGITLRYGHKFFIGKHESPLKGFFLRPELIGTSYTYDSAATKERTSSKMIAVLATAGYQYTISHFIADFWIGSGYCAGTPADTGYEHGFTVWNYLGTYNPHIALSFSIRLGYCF